MLSIISMSTAYKLTAGAVGVGFLSAITGTVLSFTGRSELEPYANMMFAGILMLMVIYAFILGVGVIDATCFAPFSEALEVNSWFKALRW